uniref:DUF7041 domain-containing protein n=1 Tax=Glossina austeni TaxID=7395 RepID=A0A1A9VTU2_GLOAU
MNERFLSCTNCNPCLRFNQLEGQSFTAAITLDTTKYRTLVGSVESVSHIIETPPNQNLLYKALKNALLSEFQDSQEKLLDNFHHGDEKFSSFLREIREVSSGKCSAEILMFERKVI